MKKNMKRLTALLMTGIMAGSLVGCGAGNSSGGDTAKGEKVKIRFYNLWPKNEDDPISMLYYDLYDEFREQNPDIDLEVISDAHEAWATKIKTMMTANDLTEVFISQPRDFLEYKDSGLFYDFTDDLEADPEWRDSFVTDAFNSYTTEDGIFGIPHSGYVEGVFYNKEIMEAHNLEVPQTYEDLVEVVKTLSAEGIPTFAIGAKDLWPIGTYLDFFMERAAGCEYYEEMCNDRDVSADNEMYLSAFTKFQELSQLGAFPEGVLSQSQSDAVSMFVQGKCAMFVTGSWDIGAFEAADNGTFGSRVGFTTFPVFEDGKTQHPDSTCAGYGKTFCIAEKASPEQKEAALRFVKFMNNSSVATRYLEECETITACKPDKEQIEVSPLLQSAEEVLNSVSQTWNTEYAAPGFYDEEHKAGQRLLMGEITPQEALEMFEEARLEFQFSE